MAKQWHKALELDQLPEGRVMTVTLGTHSVCMTHYDGKYGAMDNHCPHQGGPLGEGSIENGLLRCPWHGWDYCPLTGTTRLQTAARNRLPDLDGCTHKDRVKR